MGTAITLLRADNPGKESTVLLARNNYSSLLPNPAAQIGTVVHDEPEKTGCGAVPRHHGSEATDLPQK